MAQTFTATANGSYKVVVTIGGCSSTSSCVAVNSVGMIEQAGIADLQLFPNPGTGVYTVVLGQQADVTVTNVVGEIVLKQSLVKGHNSLNIERFANGVYYLSVVSGNRSSVLKVVKQ